MKYGLDIFLLVYIPLIFYPKVFPCRDSVDCYLLLNSRPWFLMVQVEGGDGEQGEESCSRLSFSCSDYSAHEKICYFNIYES